MIYAEDISVLYKEQKVSILYLNDTDEQFELVKFYNYTFEISEVDYEVSGFIPYFETDIEIDDLLEDKLCSDELYLKVFNLIVETHTKMQQLDY